MPEDEKILGFVVRSRSIRDSEWLVTRVGSVIICIRLCSSMIRSKFLSVQETVGLGNMRTVAVVISSGWEIADP